MSTPPGSGGRAARLFGRWNARFPSAGHLALAALGLGVVTGVALSVGYDVAAPRHSLALVQLTSRSGRLLRALHAWSGHVLLVVALLHVVEHLVARSEERMRFGGWVRAVASGPLLLAILLSGFMLKGDAEGELARQVVAGLLERLPVGGAALATALLGAGPDLQLPYLHHVATLTVVTALLAVEHGRRIWPSEGAVVAVLLAASAGALLLPPALHDGVDPVVKGPWYFVALQEALHWLSRPSVAWAFLALPVAALVALPRVHGPVRARLLGALALGLVAYVLVGAWAEVFRGAGWELRAPWSGGPSSRGERPLFRPLAWARLDGELPRVRGEVEGCLACHREVAGIEPAHGAEVAGCAGCHLGDPFAPDAAGAHAGMVRVPGNLDAAALTCGRNGCHGELVSRVRGSLMGTARGMIAVDRWAFGEQPTPDGSATAADLGSSPADTHLRQLCVSCHLGRLKAQPAPTGELSRGGGCAACHLSYPERRDYSRESPGRFTHPRLSVQVADGGCLGCHGRSGRISLSYAGWREAGPGEDDARARAAGSSRRLEDGRIVARAPADVHHDAGMACIDCHTAREAMGDGRTRLHEEQATRVRCETCHRTRAGRSVPNAELDAEAAAIVRARFRETPPARLLLEDRSGEPLTGAWELPDGRVEQRGKLGGKRLLATRPARACTELEGHARLSCQSCHTPWVTSCAACHTQWDAEGKAVHALDGLERTGAWVEYDGPPRSVAPALGVLRRDGESRIEPVAPGMIMTLNPPGAAAPRELPAGAGSLVGSRTRFLRAYALAVPHTTTRAGRTCASCHQDPFALGYGRGTLALERRAGRWAWRFEPVYAPSPQDGLPADAWIPFPSSAAEAAKGVATRTELAPLERDAQLRTLAVGACLPCHDPGSPAGRALYARFRDSVARAGPRCRVPAPPP
jgi:hypothetical protein